MPRCGMEIAKLQPWSVRAVNLPEHGRNPIHTDAGARAAGFPAALVAGVSTYAYLTHPPAAGWGLDWVGGGGAEVRFLSPVFDRDELTCLPTGDEQVVVEANVGGETRANVHVWCDAEAPTTRRDGETLVAHEVKLGDGWRDYGVSLGDDFSLYRDHGLVHPAAWPALANDVVHAQLVSGSWIHVRSRIRHHGLVPVGSHAVVESTVFDRFTTSAGDRAVLDVEITVDGQVVATIEHEAIVSVNR